MCIPTSAGGIFKVTMFVKFHLHALGVVLLLFNVSHVLARLLSIVSSNASTVRKHLNAVDSYAHVTWFPRNIF